MIHKTVSPMTGHIRVIFELPACIWADRIYLVGDFNDWGVNAQPFMQGRDGVWRAIVDLPSGRSFEFRYLVDGNWQTDYHADGWVENDYGEQNSLVSASLSSDTVLRTDHSSLLHEELAQVGRRSRPHVLGTSRQAMSSAKSAVDATMRSIALA